MEINNMFKEFYMSLYLSEQDTTPNFGNFFENLDIPSLDQSAVEEIERSITTAELSTAASSLQNGKSPGPDGFPPEFLKKFWHKLAPLLLDMYNESFELGHLSQTLNQASISLLLKKGKDPLACSSYCPISLLNVDFKLLSKLLALRLESFLPSIISLDQTVLYTIPPPSTHEAVILLDAEKAFDRVEWDYLLYALEKFGFKINFISWIKLLNLNHKPQSGQIMSNQNIFVCFAPLGKAAL